MKTQTALFLAILTAAAEAEPLRMSANCSIPADTTDLGGKKTASAAYSIDASIGGVTGIATAGPPATPTETAKTGYIAQLYEVTGLALNAAPLTIDEGGMRQLSAWQSLDDATFLAVPATSVTWSVLSGPISIDTSGLATAEFVYKPMPASAQGIYAGNTSPSLALMVLNLNKDDYREYGRDEMDDDWQVLYFGPPPNPIAGPLFDPDGDGQNNLFEFRTGYVPTAASSRFITRGLEVSGGNFQLELSRVQPGTRYLFQRTTDFVTWTNVFELTPATDSAPFTQPLPTDGTKSFYRVGIMKP